MLHYILQVIFFQLAFLLVYELLLKKETFFSANRWYLLLIPVISLLLPLLKIESLGTIIPEESVARLSGILLPEVYLGTAPQNVENLPQVNIRQQQGLQVNWWLIAYSLGVIFNLGFFIKKYKNLQRLFRFRKVSEEKDFRIIEIPNSKIACTFYKTVFLGEKLSEEEKQQILTHELVHVKQKHSLDLVFFELLKIIFWFNPLVYIFQHKIAVLHEFIADAKAVKTPEKCCYYEQLLNIAFNTQNISFINQFFNHSLIKKRILMLQKPRSTTIAKFKYLVMLPLIIVMLIYSSCSTTHDFDKEDIGEKSIVTLDDGTIAYMVKEIRKNTHKNFILNIANYDGSDIFIEGKEDHSKSSKESNFPYAVIDEVPAFLGCEDIALNEERKLCTTQKILEFVYDKFDMSIRNRFGLPGINRVIVQFTIDENGNIRNVKSRATAPELEIEAERVINSLPAMTPGKQNGEIVGVIYSLPIKFKLDK